MSKNKKQFKIVYNKEDDSYEIYISTDAGKTFDFSKSWMCFKTEEQKANLWIGRSFANEIIYLTAIGYQLVEF